MQCNGSGGCGGGGGGGRNGRDGNLGSGWDGRWPAVAKEEKVAGAKKSMRGVVGCRRRCRKGRRAGCNDSIERL